MKQQVQLNLNSSSSKELTELDKEYLIKYCYHTYTNVQEETRLMLKECMNDNILRELRYILINFIMPYFHVDRTVFNRIRNTFVSFMHACLSDKPRYTIKPVSYLLSYKDNCSESGAFTSNAAYILSQDLIQKASRSITRLNENNADLIF